jgi:hypothetical protein
MAKTKISEFSATSADNTDITNINIAEGCSPANVNNAIRSLMSLLKNQQDGSSGDPFTVAGTLVSSGQVDITGAFRLDGTAGASGQVLLSAGSSNTPTWGAALGTMAAQNSTAVAITGGTITGITDLTVADGGTGASSITANSVILGNGTSALSGNLVAPGTNGNVLTSNGTTWTSAAATGITITTGSAPYYGARAWVNFNGLSGASPVIRGSVNISSVTRTATGQYTIAFTSALADINYVVTGNASTDGSGRAMRVSVFTTNTTVTAPTTSSFIVNITSDSNVSYDSEYVTLAVFR